MVIFKCVLRISYLSAPLQIHVRNSILNNSAHTKAIETYFHHRRTDGGRHSLNAYQILFTELAYMIYFTSLVLVLGKVSTLVIHCRRIAGCIDGFAKYTIQQIMHRKRLTRRNNNNNETSKT